MESFTETIPRQGGNETREYFADRDTTKVRDGWFVLKVKSFKDPRKSDKEMIPDAFVDGLRFKPTQEFQCHPDHAKILVELSQVEVVKAPKEKKSNETPKMKGAA